MDTSHSSSRTTWLQVSRYEDQRHSSFFLEGSEISNSSFFFTSSCVRSLPMAFGCDRKVNHISPRCHQRVYHILKMNMIHTFIPLSPHQLLTRVRAFSTTRKICAIRYHHLHCDFSTSRLIPSRIDHNIWCSFHRHQYCTTLPLHIGESYSPYL